MSTYCFNEEEAGEHKFSTYKDLANTCRERGWKAWVFPVVVGCRGFPAQSAQGMIGALGIKGTSSKNAVTTLSKTAEDIQLALVKAKRSELAAIIGEQCLITTVVPQS